MKNIFLDDNRYPIDSYKREENILSIFYNDDANKIMLQKNCNLIIDIESEKFENLSKNIYFENMNFEIKEEFHLTIFGNKIGAKIRDLEFKYPDIKDTIEDEINSFTWNIYFTKDFYVIKKNIDSNDYKYSIIQIVESHDLISLFESLNKKFPELDLEKPFPHITIYTFNSEEGIALYSEKEFNSYKIAKIKI